MAKGSFERTARYCVAAICCAALLSPHLVTALLVVGVIAVLALGLWYSLHLARPSTALPAQRRHRPGQPRPTRRAVRQVQDQRPWLARVVLPRGEFAF